jgi:hypothetical protein
MLPFVNSFQLLCCDYCHFRVVTRRADRLNVELQWFDQYGGDWRDYNGLNPANTLGKGTPQENLKPFGIVPVKVSPLNYGETVEY